MYRWAETTARARAEQLLGLLLASRRDLEDAIVYALERGFDLLVLDGTGALGGEWPELRTAPDLALVHDTIATLRRLKKEDMIDIAWFGGARSGTDAAKLVGLGVNAIGYGVAVALALGGEITHTGMRFAAADASTVLNLLSQISAAAPLRGQLNLSCAPLSVLRAHDYADLLGDDAVVLDAAVLLEVEDGAPDVLAEREVDLTGHQIVVLGHRHRRDLAGRGDDARAPDEPEPVLVAGLGGGDHPAAVLVRVRLHGDVDVEHAQVLRLVGVDVEVALLAVREIVDMPDRRASLLVRLCMQNGGWLSARKRKQFRELHDEEIAAMEAAIQEAVQSGGHVGRSDRRRS